MQPHRLTRIIVLFVVLALSASLPALLADDWSRFRGPNGSGIADGKALPHELGPGQNVVWETEVPFGRSSPVFAGDRIYITAVEEEALVTLAIDRSSGAILWKSAIERSHTADLHTATDSSTSTPVTDGENVYAFFHEAGLVSYDADGNQRWHISMEPFRNFYGMGTSPILAGDKLLLVCDQAQGSFLLAIDKNSGKELWRQPRPGRVESYSTPLLYPDTNEPKLVIHLGSKWIDAYDLASGEIAWTLPGLGVGPVSSPVLAGDLLFVNAPNQASEPLDPFSSLITEHDQNEDGLIQRSELMGNWMHAHFGFIDIDGDGNVSANDWKTLGEEMASDHWGLYAVQLPKESGQPEILWNNRQAVAYIPTVLHYDGVLYMVKGSILASFDPETGEVHKRARMEEVSKDVYASPIGGDGKIYIASLDGKMAVLSAGEQWEILAVNDLGEGIYASPAISDGRLYVRTRSKLYSFGVDPPSSEAR